MKAADGRHQSLGRCGPLPILQLAELLQLLKLEADVVEHAAESRHCSWFWDVAAELLLNHLQFHWCCSWLELYCWSAFLMRESRARNGKVHYQRGEHAGGEDAEGVRQPWFPTLFG